MHNRLMTFEIDSALVALRTQDELAAYVHSLDGVRVRVIGESRDGVEMFGLTFGSGPRHVSVIGGSHADEPVGPMTAQALPIVIQESFPDLLEQFTFHIVPQMNPDGADRNRLWFSNPLRMEAYLNNTIRELPGEDIEFGFGEGDRVRPECRAAQEFLSEAGQFSAHFSLHGMAFAEGAWCLLCPPWVSRAEPYMDAFEKFCDAQTVPLHDVERNGEKGFSRIRKGFCTTPNSVAMKEFFLERNDPAMAAKFMLSSMEWIMNLGGDPLCIVSELPLFVIGKPSESLDDPVKSSLKEDLTALRASGSVESGEELDRVIERYQLWALPLDQQLRLQVGMIMLALSTLDLST